MFALVGATGTDLGLVAEYLAGSLTNVSYECEQIRVIELLQAFKQWADLPEHPEETRIETRMDAGDDFRKRLQDGSALARLTVGRVRDLRQKRTGDSKKPRGRVAYILRSLKRKEEIARLREVYGKNFFVIGAFSPRAERVTSLAQSIARSNFSATSDAYRFAAEKLIQRDLDDQTKELGQRVGDTFPLADVFVNVLDTAELQSELDRFIRMLFGFPFHTPRIDEYGMFHAEAAALRSAALSRQVGAAITTARGSILAVGTNDVPRSGGGLYWEGDVPDHRDHVERKDSSDEIRRNMVAEVLERLSKAGWLTREQENKGVGDLVSEALDQRNPPILRGAQVMRVIEYGRAVHAEMSAIVDAAMRGVSVQGGTLYTTTYPCHNCARHIIAAGIDRVVYIEPYPKSLTYELHKDAMVNDVTVDGLVSFQAFMGLAPRRYLEFFEMADRKDGQGKIVEWEGRSAQPRGVSEDVTYLARELNDYDNFLKRIQQVGIMGEEEAKGD